jgi:hypothetical protein
MEIKDMPVILTRPSRKSHRPQRNSGVSIALVIMMGVGYGCTMGASKVMNSTTPSKANRVVFNRLATRVLLSSWKIGGAKYPFMRSIMFFLLIV